MGLAEQIADLEAILQGGAESVSVDGVSVRYKMDEIRRRLAELRREQEGTSPRRPRNATINLSGF